MRIVNGPEPPWWAFLFPKATNIRRKKLTAFDSIERGNSGQHHFKLFGKGRSTGTSLSVLDDGIGDGRNTLGDDGGRQGAWTYDVEAGVYRDIRRLILQRRIEDAERALAALPFETAHRYYLNGLVLWEKGKYAEAYRSVLQATAMAPENREYARALDCIMQAYHPLAIFRIFRRFLERTWPWLYIILAFLGMVWLICRIF